MLSQRWQTFKAFNCKLKMKYKILKSILYLGLQVKLQVNRYIYTNYKQVFKFFNQPNKKIKFQFEKRL